MEGVHLLENRGYDSAGMVTIQENQQDNRLVVSKYASDSLSKVDCFQKIESEIRNHQVLNFKLNIVLLIRYWAYTLGYMWYED